MEQDVQASRFVKGPWVHPEKCWTRRGQQEMPFQWQSEQREKGRVLESAFKAQIAWCQNYP